MSIDRTPKPCLHKLVHHEHGARLAYALDRCRCTPCTAANTAYESQRARLKAYGRPTTSWVDAGPVRAHVQALQAAGLGWRRIANRAGVANGVVARLLFGKTDTNGFHPPSRRINPTAAEHLLAVPVPDVDGLLPGARVDGTGTRRRLQALVAIGWSQSELGRRLGMSAGNFNGLITGRKCIEVVAATHRSVVALYEEMWGVPAPVGYSRSRALSVAAERRWVPPMAWDDDTIDDPEATPYLAEDQAADVDEFVIDLVLDGQPMNVTGRDLEAAALQLAEAGLSYAAIAARVRSDEDSIRRVLNTARQRIARAAEREEAAA